MSKGKGESKGKKDFYRRTRLNVFTQTNITEGLNMKLKTRLGTIQIIKGVPWSGEQIVFRNLPDFAKTGQFSDAQELQQIHFAVTAHGARYTKGKIEISTKSGTKRCSAVAAFVQILRSLSQDEVSVTPMSDEVTASLEAAARILWTHKLDETKPVNDDGTPNYKWGDLAEDAAIAAIMKEVFTKDFLRAVAPKKSADDIRKERVTADGKADQNIVNKLKRLDKILGKMEEVTTVRSVRKGTPAARPAAKRGGFSEFF